MIPWTCSTVRFNPLATGAAETKLSKSYEGNAASNKLNCTRPPKPSKQLVSSPGPSPRETLVRFALLSLEPFQSPRHRDSH